ncbi:MAG: DeoR/GlpR family DNA-binding transcription regulator [Anaerolineaceae bacterium]|nr:DeoR/GlpR family DNA-binding transcription regulator [Anaerolineaceae bacterium]
MLSVDRRQKISEIVKEKKFITVNELASLLEVTGETIRRDLKYLDDRGELSRAHGGAYIRSYDVDIHYRETKMVEAKQHIAQICRGFIKENDVVFLDSSTTALEIAKTFLDVNLTVVTNSLVITNFLVAQPNIKTVTIGGNLDLRNLCFSGPATVSEVGRYYTQKCFISCRTLSSVHGAMDSNELLAQVRAIAVKNSNEAFLVADSTKFDDMSLCPIAPMESFSALVTEKKPHETWQNLAKEKNFRLIY